MPGPGRSALIRGLFYQREKDITGPTQGPRGLKNGNGNRAVQMKAEVKHAGGAPASKRIPPASSSSSQRGATKPEKSHRALIPGAPTKSQKATKPREGSEKASPGFTVSDFSQFKMYFCSAREREEAQSRNGKVSSLIPHEEAGAYMFSRKAWIHTMEYFLVEHPSLDLTLETKSRAARLMDHFYKGRTPHSIKKGEKLNGSLVMLCCLTLAAKNREQVVPSSRNVSNFLSTAFDPVSAQDILQMELRICRAADWKVNQVVPTIFVEALLQCYRQCTFAGDTVSGVGCSVPVGLAEAYGSVGVVQKLITDICRSLLIEVYHDYGYNNFLPSVVAAAVITCARAVVKIEPAYPRDTLKEVFPPSQESMQKCVNVLWGSAQKFCGQANALSVFLSPSSPSSL